MNGKKVLQYELGSDLVRKGLAASKFKGGQIPVAYAKMRSEIKEAILWLTKANAP